MHIFLLLEVRSTSSTIKDPPVGFSSPVIKSINVVFPVPLDPVTTILSPLLIVRFILLNMTFLSSYLKSTSFNLITLLKSWQFKFLKSWGMSKFCFSASIEGNEYKMA